LGKRDEHRDTTEAAILAAGLRVLAEGGADSITVRGIARELSLVPSALYRYVGSREDLLRLLITHAYNDLADAVESADRTVPVDELRARWRAFARALRRWAVDHPHEWALTQGAPIHGFGAAADYTFQPALRVHRLLLQLAADAEAAGLRPALAAPAGPSVLPGLPSILKLAGRPVSEQTILAGLAAWHLLAGALYAEQFRQVGSDLVDHEPYYDVMIAATERLLFGDPA
jgi:AcrR family transcriptional regulator